MKTLLAASVLVVLTAGFARAGDDDRPGRDWIPITAVTQKLQDLGFNEITKIEADDGVWKAKGYKDGQYFKVKLDPHTGQVVEQRRDDKHRSARD